MPEVNEMNRIVIPEEQQEFQYYAFISYSHRDMKWARWLQKELESYKLPSKLQETDPEKNKKSQKPIQPVFRDETSINPGKSVDEALKSELEKSKYLVVICSPASSASPWVDREVERFVEMGREDRIMPFIVEGVPHSQNEKKECYVPALRALAEKKGSSILGADVQARGKREAFLCTVAFLLGIDLETLRSREAERVRIKRITAFAVSAIFLAICAFFGVKAWNYYVPKVTYYQDYTMRFGLPEGLFQLTAQQIKTREEHYEITCQYGRIQSLAHKNQYGTITDRIDSERFDVPAYMTFGYDEAGNLISSTRYAANGIPVVTWKYADNLRVVQFEYPERTDSHNNADHEGSIAMTLAAYTQDMEADAYSNNTRRSFIAGYIIKYYDDGLIRDLYYSDMPTFGRKTKDADGIWGLRYEYNSEGQVTHIQYLNENGELLTSRDGIAQKVYTYDQDGQNIHSVKVEYQDADGNLVMNKQGWAIDIQEYENGNIVAEENRDTEGKLVINNAGWARLDVIKDQFGNNIEMYITGINGEPITDFNGWHRQTYSYDELGREIEKKGFDVNGNPVIGSEGYASCTYSYDQNGNFTEMICYDETGNKVVCYYGFASVEAVYNDRGELIERRYYDETGAPIITRDGYATIRCTYDDHGNTTERSYFGINDELVLNYDDVAVWKMKYDERGNEIEKASYDTAGNPINCYYGYAKMTSSYDKQGNVTEIAYFGENGKPILGGYGYAIVRYQYDDKSNLIETSFHGTTGQLRIINGGYAGWTSKYDDFGNEIEIRFFDTNREPIANDYGYAVRQVKYDALNNPIEIQYFDENLHPVEVEYDRFDLISSYDYFLSMYGDMIQYPVASTDICISLPEEWLYADRSINDDSEICTRWGMTADEFIEEYLSYNCYVYAFDYATFSDMYLFVNATDESDYSEISEAELLKALANMAVWLEDMGEEILLTETVEWETPYCKAITITDELIYYYYETVVNKELVTFMFMIGTDDWDLSYEQIYDRIIENVRYGGSGN